MTIGIRRIIWLTSFAVATIACGHGGGPLSPSSAPTLFVSDAIGVPHSFDIGRTYPLKATLRKSGEADEDVTTASQWASSNNNVATMAGNIVHLQGLGEIDVTASYRTLSARSIYQSPPVRLFSSFLRQCRRPISSSFAMR